MLKKFVGVLLFVFLVFGSSACTTLKTSENAITVLPSSPTPQTQVAAVSLSDQTDQSESSNNQTSIQPQIQSNNDGKVKNGQEAPIVPILYYHSVMQEKGNELRMPPEQFEAQMSYLHDRGYQSVSLEQLYLASNGRGTLPTKPFVITFDDGYVDNFTNAFPILAKHGFTATVFMITSYIDGEGFMTWGQLKELVANGWEIESHTTSHPYLTKVDPIAVLSELNLSKELLEKELGKPVKFFAYPYGDLNANVVQAVKETGHLMAVSTQRGWADVKTDAWSVHRIYCYAFMGMNEFSHRMQDPNY